jgi:hypothetical protein
MKNKNKHIDTLIEEYKITDSELQQITEVATLYADINVDKGKNLLKWTTEFDSVMIKALLKLRPKIGDDEVRNVFNNFIKTSQVQINLNDMDALLFVVFKAGVEYQKTLN